MFSGLPNLLYATESLWSHHGPSCRTLISLVGFLANVNSRSRSLYVIDGPSVCRLSSVTFVRPTQAIEIFGNIFTPRGILAIHDLCIKILRRSSQGNPSVGGLNTRGVDEYSDFGPIEPYISETVKDRSLVCINHQ